MTEPAPEVPKKSHPIWTGLAILAVLRERLPE